VRLHSRSALVRHRARRDSRSISIPNLPDSTTNMLFLGRPESVVQYTTFGIVRGTCGFRREAGASVLSAC
jgi:hypothetical protein